MRSASSRRLPLAANVLLADDNRDGNLARQSFLEEVGYRVFSVCCGHEALQILEQQPIDLLITDYKMGPVDGLELIATVRGKIRSLPVILLTGYAESLGLNCENTGADIVIQKSAKELPTLLRSAKKLLHPPKKPAGSQRMQKHIKRAQTTGL